MKTIAIPILAIVLSFTLSCQKEENDQEIKKINVTLSPGESYSSDLSQQGNPGSQFSISQQASHAAVSSLQARSDNGDMIFSYTPASQYVGNDQVQITASGDEHHGGHGGCPMHHKSNESTIYQYNITVTGNNH
jgi:hypothetical protein